MANVAKKELSEEAEAAISVLRALVSSKKGASTVQSILNDYRELEGGPLMYRKFGFANADDFLKSTGEFIVQNRMGETVVFVKPSKESAHILKMVAAQKGTKTRKSGFSILRQPQKRTGGNNWNPSAYNKMYSQMPNKRRYLPQSQTQYQQRYNNTNNPLKPFFQNSATNWSNNIRYNIPHNNSNGNPLRPLMSLKIVPPSTQNNKFHNAQLNQTSQRYSRIEPNNNNSTAKNFNKNTQSPTKPNQATLLSNDLRHKLNERGPQQYQRQSSALELQNRLNQQEPVRLTEHGNDSNSFTPMKSSVKDATQKVMSDVIVSNQIHPTHMAPAVQSTEENRSVNSRLQVTKDVTPTSPPTPEMTKVYPVYDVTMRVDIHPNSIPSTPTSVVSTITAPKTVQDRLKIHQQVDSSDLEKAARVVAPLSPALKPADLDSKSPTPVPLTPPAATNPNRPKEPFNWNQPLATPVEMLYKYAKYNDLPRPMYTYFKLSNMRIQCRVMVNGSTYSTYPEDIANEFEGQFTAAQIAIENIKRDEERNNYSVCLDSDYEIATKIHELLLQYPHGMFTKNIPEAFRKAHQVLLPDHWEFIIMSHTHMFSKEETIVFANVCEENGSNNSSPSITSEAKSMAANVLQLPWSEQYWNLYITNPVSTVEIWARLVGPQFSDRMDALITDIELSMMGDDKRKPKTVAVGEYYLVSTTDCWYRVRAEGIDFGSNYCICFFIDIGEWERVALDEIYVCDAKYLKLPGQSVCFTLDGLEDFGENPKAKSHLDNLISGKVCIGEILTQRKEYEKDGVGSFGDVRIKMILYDTSSDEDVNLNPVILKHICDDTPVPELNRKGVTTVIVTHVDDSGDVYCQLKDDAMVYIQKLINNLVKSNALDGTHRGLYKVKSAEQQLYLVQDEKDKRWYRASLEAEESGPFCRMLYVDIGAKKSVNVSNIYRLETLSVALSRYPTQAVRMKMFDIPDVTDYLLSRMRVLLKTGLTAMVKLAALSIIPLVKIYMHLEQNNILVCVNDSIRSEMELEIGSEVISNPRIAAYESSNTSIGSSVKLNTSFVTDYSIESCEAAELSKSFRGLNIEQRKLSSPVPSQVTPKLAKYPLPAVGELFGVFVTIASNPNYFIVQPYMHAKELNQMMVDLQAYCKTKAQPVPKDSVQQGEVYAGYNTDDGHWYRVLAVNILCGPIHVYFCDFGQIRVVDSESLRILPPQSRILPQQAVKAKLHGIQPLHGDWSTEDAVRFQQITVDKKFASYICNILTDEINPNEEIVDLMLIDVSTDEDIFIHKILVDEKRAVLTGK
ncbi:tudor domain-containing protein 7 [Ochlerotatus camptorhynchus]|uniref:tudor domain-containing protein 7 n=1 Tax=Ochlerotatus camptorhynchus TaxID=644619 RepID=UPI0031D30A46